MTHAKFETRSFPRSWDNRGRVPKKFGQSLDTPTLPFLQNFSYAIIGMDTLIVLAKFEVRSFTRSRDNSDWSFGWGANPNLGEGEAVGSRGWYRSKERRWVPVGSPVTFSLSLRVSEILPLLCSSSLPQISTCSPGSTCRWMAFGLGRVQLVSKISYLCDPDPRSTNVTDRRTDGQHAIAIPRFAL